jgi:hypothetical protein
MKPPVVTATWAEGYGWTLLFDLFDGPYTRLAVDRAEAERIIRRVMPGATVKWIGRGR